MSSNDIVPKLSVDQRLMLKDKVPFYVDKGASAVTYQKYNSNSASSSGCNFNFQLPSQEVVLSRELLYELNFSVQFTWTSSIPASQAAALAELNWGKDTAFCDWPLHAMCDTMNMTLNGQSNTVQMKDVIHELNRLHDKRDLLRYNSLSPMIPDVYQQYADCQNANNNPLAGFNNANDNDLLPRGSYEYVSSSWSSPTLTLYFKLIEPVLVSPFTILKDMAGPMGMSGISTLTAVFNYTNDMTRIIRTNQSITGLGSVSLNVANQADAKFHLCYLTPQPSMLLQARNVCDFYRIDRYLTQLTVTATGAGQSVNTNNIQLGVVPDKMIIGVRPRFTSGSVGNMTYGNYWCPINTVSINFNNQAGLLSSSSQQQLFKISQHGGSNQNYLEFKGNASTWNNGAYSNVNTSGSLLVVDFAKDLQLADWLAPGSLGQFNINCNLNIDETANLTSYEIIQIFVSSGVWINERGVSQSQVGVLNSTIVIDESARFDQAVPSQSMERMVGGSIYSKVKSALPFVGNVAKSVLQNIDNPYAQLGAQALNALGMGRSGGGPVGGMNKHVK